jgi:DNA-binding transcriptional MerR regulator
MASAKRELFKAPDVCEMARLQPYVLRSWEAEFPGLGRAAADGGARVYRREDVELVLRIKQMVFGEGLTLAGARRRLEETRNEPSIAAEAVEHVFGDMARTRLKEVRNGLEAILRMLQTEDQRVPELTLVPPSKASAKSTTGKRRKAS